MKLLVVIYSHRGDKEHTRFLPALLFQGAGKVVAGWGIALEVWINLLVQQITSQEIIHTPFKKAMIVREKEMLV